MGWVSGIGSERGFEQEEAGYRCATGVVYHERDEVTGTGSGDVLGGFLFLILIENEGGSVRAENTDFELFVRAGKVGVAGVVAEVEVEAVVVVVVVKGYGGAIESEVDKWVVQNKLFARETAMRHNYWYTKADILDRGTTAARGWLG